MQPKTAHDVPVGVPMWMSESRQPSGVKKPVCAAWAVTVMVAPRGAGFGETVTVSSCPSDSAAMTATPASIRKFWIMKDLLSESIGSPEAAGEGAPRRRGAPLNRILLVLTE